MGAYPLSFREKYFPMQMDLQNQTSNRWIYYQVQVSISCIGYSQVHGLDYNETFSLVARMHYIRVVISIATSKKWEVLHMDVNSTFLHGDLEEEINMR